MAFERKSGCAQGHSSRRTVRTAPLPEFDNATKELLQMLKQSAILLVSGPEALLLLQGRDVAFQILSSHDYQGLALACLAVSRDVASFHELPTPLGRRGRQPVACASEAKAKKRATALHCACIALACAAEWPQNVGFQELRVGERHEE